MKRLTATALLLVALASPLWAQTSTTGGPYDSTTQTDMNTNTTTNDNMNATTNDNTTTSESLPATASPLPLLSLVGLGAMASSLWLRRRREG